MKIGLYIPIAGIHGGSTVAIGWHRAMLLAGYDVKLFAISRSGKKLSGWRCDAEYDILGSKRTEETREYLKQFDVVISVGGPHVDAEKGIDLPGGTVELLAELPCLLVYRGQSWGHVLKQDLDGPYQAFQKLMDIPSVKGIVFPRTKILESFIADKKVMKILNGRPTLEMKHPVFLDEIKDLSTGKALLSMVKLTPGKHIKDILKALKKYPKMLNGIPFEIWGNTSFSRYQWILEQMFPDLMSEHHCGDYDRRDMPKVYERGAFSIDLTDFVGDGGAQCCYIESVLNGVVPIVLDNWVLNGSAVSIPGRSPEEIRDGIQLADSLTPDERSGMLKRGIDYFKAEHDPITGAHKLYKELEALL